MPSTHATACWYGSDVGLTAPLLLKDSRRAARMSALLGAASADGLATGGLLSCGCEHPASKSPAAVSSAAPLREQCFTLAALLMRLSTGPAVPTYAPPVKCACFADRAGREGLL